MATPRHYRVVCGYNGRAQLLVTVGSTVHNPTGGRALLAPGTVITFESAAPNGNVWFQTPIGRAKLEAGSLENLLRAGVITPAATE